MTSAHETKSDYHHGDLAHALLDAVEEIILERGIDNVSLREAARRAGVSHSAPAHHFGDKSGMLAAFAANGFELFGRHLAAAARSSADRSTEDRCRVMGVAYVRFALEHRAHFEAMFRAGIDKRDVTTDLGQAAAGAFEILASLVRTMKGQGLFRDTDERYVATYLWALSHGLATLMIDGLLDSFYEDHTTDEILAAVFAIPAGDLRFRAVDTPQERGEPTSRLEA